MATKNQRSRQRVLQGLFVDSNVQKQFEGNWLGPCKTVTVLSGSLTRKKALWHFCRVELTQARGQFGLLSRLKERAGTIRLRGGSQATCVDVGGHAMIWPTQLVRNGSGVGGVILQGSIDGRNWEVVRVRAATSSGYRYLRASTRTGEDLGLDRFDVLGTYVAIQRPLPGRGITLPWVDEETPHVSLMPLHLRGSIAIGCVCYLGLSEATYSNPISRGLVNVTCSDEDGLAKGNVENFAEPTPYETCLADLPLSWFCMDLGADHRARVSAYSLRHGSSADRCILRNWAFQASQDTSSWVTLRVHVNDQSMSGGFGSAAWSVQCATCYRYFRVLQTDANSSGSHVLALSGFELYGCLSRIQREPRVDHKRTSISEPLGTVRETPDLAAPDSTAETERELLIREIRRVTFEISKLETRLLPKGMQEEQMAESLQTKIDMVLSQIRSLKGENQGPTSPIESVTEAQPKRGGIRIVSRRMQHLQKLAEMQQAEQRKKLEKLALAESSGMLQTRRRPVMRPDDVPKEDVEVVDNGGNFEIDFSTLHDEAFAEKPPIPYGRYCFRTSLVFFLFFQAFVAVLGLYMYLAPVTWDGNEETGDAPFHATNGPELRLRCKWVGRFYFYSMISTLITAGLCCEVVVISKAGGLNLLQMLPLNERAKEVQSKLAAHPLSKLLYSGMIAFALMNMFAFVTYEGFYLLTTDTECWPFIEGTPLLRRTIHMQLACGFMRAFTIIGVSVRAIMADWNEASEIENS